MEGKKISFGFMKTKKAEKPVVEEEKDYIECLEEKSIKVVGGETVEEAKPLVIPMKPNTLVTAERLKEIAAKVESSLEEPEKETTAEIKIEAVENETLDQMAIRELLQDSKKDIKVENADLTVPIPSKPVIDGQKESSLEDYETVPIQDFGMAMLRGMGWTPGKDQAKYKQPELRPKGLGLGADKVIKENQKKKSSNNKDEELSIVKGSYVKITTGKHSGYYGKVVSLDEENGRVMVDITVKKETVSLSEFMMQPVTKTEFDKESKVKNTNAYEEYKKQERSQSQRQSKTETKNINDREASSSQTSKVSTDKKEPKEENRRRDKDRSSNGTKDSSRNDKDRRASSESEERSRRNKDKYKRHSSSSEDRKKRDKYRRDSSEDRNKRKKDKKRASSHESLSSVSESEKRKKNKQKSKRYDSSDSGSERKSRKKDKRDIDKKRKGKKKKRDRDRSPNYKKYRK